MKTGEKQPYAYVCNEQLGKTKEKFNSQFGKLSREILNSIEIRNDPDKNFPIRFYFLQTPQEWREIIKSGRFVEEIIKIFDILAKFIDPIDRALAEVLGKKRVKK